MEASRRRIISASAENRFLPIPFRLPASVALPPLESEKPTASPQRSPEMQIDHRPDGLRRRPPCCFSVASWSLRRHGVVSDFEWTFVHFCSCLPSMQIMTPPGALCTVSVTLLAAGIGLVCDGDVAL